MPTYILDQKTPETPPFDFLGDCYICATGEGQIRIQRKIGSTFHDVTDAAGVPMAFTNSVGSTVIFNNCVTANKKMEHKVIGDTTTQIRIDILKERG